MNIQDTVFEFLNRYSSFLITTHDTADPDGLGAEKLLSFIAINLGKNVRVVNSSPTPENYSFMDPEKNIETYNNTESLPEGAAMVIVDTSDEYTIGKLRDFIPHAKEVFVIDHHEHNKFNSFKGYIDNTASSTSELIVELAQSAGIAIPPECAAAAYAGIVYDTGFFAYPKTTNRTFRAALSLVEAGVTPNIIYRALNESASAGALLLQKTVLSTLEIHNSGRVAAQILRKEDLENCGAFFEDAENFINIPLKSREVEISILVKEEKEGNVRCSLRSKGSVNVSKIAQALGGGGHVTAAGFKSQANLEKTLATALEKVSEALDAI